MDNFPVVLLVVTLLLFFIWLLLSDMKFYNEDIRANERITELEKKVDEMGSLLSAVEKGKISSQQAKDYRNPQ